MNKKQDLLRTVSGQKPEDYFHLLEEAFPDLRFSVQDKKTKTVLTHGTGLSDEMPDPDWKQKKQVQIPLPNGYRFVADPPADEDYAQALPLLVKNLLDNLPDTGSVPPSNDNSLFFRHLMYTEHPDEADALSLLSESTRYEFSEPRLILLIEATAPAGRGKPEELWLPLLSLIRKHPCCGPEDICGLMPPNRLALCKKVSEADYPVKTKIGQLLGTLPEQIHGTFSGRVRIAVSFVAESLSEYSYCLRTADTLLSLPADAAEAPETKSADSAELLFAIDVLPRLLFYSIPYPVRRHFLEEYAAALRSHPEWAETLDALMQTNMNITRAAKLLYLHKNSLLFRLRNMQEELNIPSLQRDSSKFFWMLLYYYCHESD